MGRAARRRPGAGCAGLCRRAGDALSVSPGGGPGSGQPRPVGRGRGRGREGALGRASPVPRSRRHLPRASALGARPEGAARAVRRLCVPAFPRRARRSGAAHLPGARGGGGGRGGRAGRAARGTGRTELLGVGAGFRRLGGRGVNPKGKVQGDSLQEGEREKHVRLWGFSSVDQRVLRSLGKVFMEGRDCSGEVSL